MKLESLGGYEWILTDGGAGKMFVYLISTGK